MIKKAILPVAGMGTRFLPVTKSSPKEMLPIIDKPVIQYIVEEAVDSGIEEIIFVTGKSKRAIEDYFDSDQELIRVLQAKKNRENDLKELKRLENLAKITYVRQPEALGDGHAILCAEHCIAEGEDFAVLFGDVIIDHDIPALAQMMDIYNTQKSSVIGVQEFDLSVISNYGVIAYEDNLSNKVAGQYLIKGLVEKPKASEAPSNLGILGKYICTYDVLKSIAQGSNSGDGEKRLIDGFRFMLDQGQSLFASKILGDFYDTGSKIGWLHANLGFANKNPELRKSLAQIWTNYDW